MNSIQSSLYTVAIALCAFSTGILSGRKSRTGRSPTYVTGFLIIETFSFVLELLMIHPATPLKALWLGLRMSTGLLVAPCLWLAIKENVEGLRPPLAALGRNQFVAILMGVSLTLPLVASAHLGTDYYDPFHPVSALHSRLIHGTMLLCIAVFAWQIPFYLWRCRRLLLQQLAGKNPEGNARAWLHLPLVMLFTTWVLGLLRTVHCASHAPQEFSVLFAFTDVSVTVGAIYTMVRRASWWDSRAAAGETDVPVVPLDAPPPSPQLAAGFAAPQAPIEVIVPGPELPAIVVAPLNAVAPADPPAVASVTPIEPKYSKSHLSPVIRARIKRKIGTAMSTQELYRDSLLNLRSLSAGIRENPHYVSQVINQELNSSFYQLVNHYRIEQAKKLLRASPGQTVLEIALAVGFNSKSTFNTAFLRNTGTTPRAFRAAQP